MMEMMARAEEFTRERRTCGDPEGWPHCPAQFTVSIGWKYALPFLRLKFFEIVKLCQYCLLVEFIKSAILAFDHKYNHCMLQNIINIH